jgi:hypothetical protein
VDRDRPRCAIAILLASPLLAAGPAAGGSAAAILAGVGSALAGRLRGNGRQQPSPGLHQRWSRAPAPGGGQAGKNADRANRLTRLGKNTEVERCCCEIRLRAERQAGQTEKGGRKDAPPKEEFLSSRTGFQIQQRENLLRC